MYFLMSREGVGKFPKELRTSSTLIKWSLGTLNPGKIILQWDGSIDYKKAYDMVPHPWILECLRLFGAAKNIRKLA